MNHQSATGRNAGIEFVIPFCIVVIGTIVCLTTDLDIELSRLYFDSEQQLWPASKTPLITLTYRWGPILTALVAVWALFRFFASYMHPRFWAKRAVSLFVLLCILIGPVVIVNGIVKESWRRPRPRDIIEFGGSHSFRKVLEFGNREYRGKSFPSGHASAGFILVLFYFLLKEKRPGLAWLALLFAIGWGCWLGYVRIVLGGHFFSDNLYAFGINWFVVWLCYYRWYLPYREKKHDQAAFQQSRRRYAIGSALLLVTIGLLAFRFLFSTPFRIDYPPETTVLPADIKKLTIQVRVKKGDILIRNSNSGNFAVQTWISGHAPTDIQAKRDLTIHRNAEHWKIRYEVEPEGFYYEYQSHTYIFKPQHLKIELDLFTKQGAVIWEDKQ